ncbi:hypothetical protein HYQ46_008761 [Verticillium longisporum]|nr:hypothetical protein HYQ46_008761 [Verticillium longisporum]
MSSLGYSTMPERMIDRKLRAPERRVHHRCGGAYIPRPLPPPQLLAFERSSTKRAHIAFGLFILGSLGRSPSHTLLTGALYLPPSPPNKAL